jgi:hypothetical protein
MDIINTKLHGFIDYAFGIFLIASPWIFGYDNGNSAAQWVPVVIGSITLVMSLCTNYEAGLFKLIDMRAHLLMDALLSIVLGLSPWIFNFYYRISQPHFIMGCVALVITLISSKYPYHGREEKKREAGEHDEQERLRKSA